MVFKMKANSAVDRLEDPRQLVDYAYDQQQELLRRTKQGLVEVATAKVRLERQSQSMREKVPRLEEQAARAVSSRRSDLARLSLQRKQAVLAELEGLDRQVTEVAQEERKLTNTEQQLAGKVEEFRTKRDAISARYSAAQAHVRVNEALSGVSGEFAELGMALGRAAEKTDRMEARASAIGSLFEVGSLPALPTSGGDAVDQELNRVTVDDTVEQELASLQARFNPGDAPAALATGPEEETKR